MAEFSKEEVLQRLEQGESLERADLSGLDLQGVCLVKANLARVDLAGANLSGADLRGANLTNASMREAFLSDTKLDGAVLRNADLDGANLSAASLVDADLANANLEGANLERAQAHGAHFSHAVLTDARLGKAELGADLRRAVLDETNLEEADLSAADLRDCELVTSILDGAILDGAKVFRVALLREQLSQTLIEWWDISRSGDGSSREDGNQVGAFLEAGAAAPLPPAAVPAESRTRFFGPGDVLRNAEFEIGDGSAVEVQGRLENCKIILGEDARLTIGEAGVLRDCRVAGPGGLYVHGQIRNGSDEALTMPKVFFVGASGSVVATIQQPSGLTRFGFEPGCSVRLKITT